MIDFFDRYYSIRSEKAIFKKIRYYAALRFMIRWVSNLLIPIYFSLTKKNKKYCINKGVNDSERILVSLTSFPARIKRVWLVIESILRQSKKPGKIILWLSSAQFPNLEKLPRRLLDQRNRGLEIRIVDEDLRSHKKYFYALLEFPNHWLVTIDDDILYRSRMIEDLFIFSIKYPASIIAQYGSQILWNGEELMPYSYWPRIKKTEKSSTQSYFGSGGGTLFPPGALSDLATRKDLFTSLTPTADDVWLNAMCRMKGTEIVTTDYFTIFLPVINRTNITLAAINNDREQNDVQFSLVRNYFIKMRNLDLFKPADSKSAYPVLNNNIK